MVEEPRAECRKIEQAPMPHKGQQKLREKLCKAEQKCKTLQRQLAKFKRQSNRKDLKDKKQLDSPSPESKIDKLLKGQIVTPEIKKALLFGEILKKQLKATRLQTRGKRATRFSYFQGFAHHELQKCKLIGHAKELISHKQYRQKRINSGLPVSFGYQPTSRSDALDPELKRSIQTFLEQDINSRMCPGVKDKKRMGKTLHQKRILLSSLKSLHEKYCLTSNTQISLASFYRCRPKYIVAPKAADRETCLCTKHANTQLMVERMHHLRLIPFSKADDMCKIVCCDDNNKDCMLGICLVCSTKVILPLPSDDNLNDNVTLSQWKSRNEDRTIKGKDKTVRLMEKRQELTTKADILARLNVVVPEFLQHVYTIRHQYAALKLKKETLSVEEAIIHCDFSENYVLKYHQEVQSMHFGTSKRQLSMHTSVVYLVDSSIKTKIDGTQTSCRSFCTVSDKLDHGVHAIWAHLHPILVEIKNKYPKVCTLHFCSDGPTSQYRNRMNLFAMTTILRHMNPNICSATWNYTESGHGKDAMDGVGGVLKMTADRHVLQGNDVASVKQFAEFLNSACRGVTLYSIPGEDICKIQKWLPTIVPPVPAIKRAHQITWTVEHQNKLYL